jgi:hypothetical protein
MPSITCSYGERRGDVRRLIQTRSLGSGHTGAAPVANRPLRTCHARRSRRSPDEPPPQKLALRRDGSLRSTRPVGGPWSSRGSTSAARSSGARPGGRMGYRPATSAARLSRLLRTVLGGHLRPGWASLTKPVASMDLWKSDCGRSHSPLRLGHGCRDADAANRHASRRRGVCKSPPCNDRNGNYAGGPGASRLDWHATRAGACHNAACGEMGRSADAAALATGRG